MGKSKKKDSKKGKKDELSDDMLDAATSSVRKFRKVTREIGRLSTGQKVVGGVALAAAGLVYLAANRQSGPETPIISRLLALAGNKSAKSDEEEPASTVEAEEVAVEPAAATEAALKARKPRKGK